MPELPEVETTLRGITPHICQQNIRQIVVRQPRLRWPVPRDLNNLLINQKIKSATRRGKYLLLKTAKGTLLLHLGMSGSLRILKEPAPAGKHDHLDILFANQKILRLNDPRRFGAVLWTSEDPCQHPLLVHLGPEPLTRTFSAHYLKTRAKRHKIAVKSFIMDSKIVVGVGNIYATEALFLAKIHPEQPANQIRLADYERLVSSIKKVLKAAIQQGGTTLKNFITSDGKPGYFAFHLKAYGRKGQACVECGAALVEVRLAQRSTVYCPACQPLEASEGVNRHNG